MFMVIDCFLLSLFIKFGWFLLNSRKLCFFFIILFFGLYFSVRVGLVYDNSLSNYKLAHIHAAKSHEGKYRV